MSWLITVLGSTSPRSPARRAPTVPMLTTVTSSPTRRSNASVVSAAAAVLPIPVTTTSSPAGTYAASAAVALTTSVVIYAARWSRQAAGLVIGEDLGVGAAGHVGEVVEHGF